MKEQIKTILIGVLFLYCIAVPIVRAVTRDLTIEQQITAAIEQHKVDKVAYFADVEKLLVKVADPMLTRGQGLINQANTIRRTAEAYFIAAGISDDQAAKYLNLVDQHLDMKSIEKKRAYMDLFKHVCFIVSETLTNETYSVPDPNTDQ